MVGSTVSVAVGKAKAGWSQGKPVPIPDTRTEVRAFAAGGYAAAVVTPRVKSQAPPGIDASGQRSLQPHVDMRANPARRVGGEGVLPSAVRISGVDHGLPLLLPTGPEPVRHTVRSEQPW